MICLNEKFKLLFLDNNRILVKKGINSGEAISLTNLEFSALKNICNGNISILDEKTIQLLTKKYPFIYQSKIMDKYHGTPFEKTLCYFQTVFEKDVDYIDIYKNKTILVVGVGGIGGGVITHLLALGVENFIIVDFDYVNSTNLNRQFCFSPSDVGKNKIDVMEQYIKNRNPNANIIKIKSKISLDTKIKKIMPPKEMNIDLVFNAADTPIYIVRKKMLEYCVENRITYAHATSGINIGKWIIIDKEKRNIMQNMIKQCDFIIDNLQFTYSCKGSNSIMNSIMVDMVCRDLMFYLIGENKFVRAFNHESIFEY